MENTLTRKPGLIMGLLVVLGAMLRLLYITKPVMYDEAWTYVDSASQPIWWFTTRYASKIATCLIPGSSICWTASRR